MNFGNKLDKCVKVIMFVGLLFWWFYLWYRCVICFSFSVFSYI